MAKAGVGINVKNSPVITRKESNRIVSSLMGKTINFSDKTTVNRFKKGIQGSSGKANVKQKNTKDYTTITVFGAECKVEVSKKQIVKEGMGAMKSLGFSDGQQECIHRMLKGFLDAKSGDNIYELTERHFESTQTKKDMIGKKFYKMPQVPEAESWKRTFNKLLKGKPSAEIALLFKFMKECSKEMKLLDGVLPDYTARSYKNREYGKELDEFIKLAEKPEPNLKTYVYSLLAFLITVAIFDLLKKS